MVSTFVSLKIAVASHADAWIEIINAVNCPEIKLSHPSRMRGLKYAHLRITPYSNESHPTRMRGLKYTVEVDHLVLLGRIPRGYVD